MALSESDSASRLRSIEVAIDNFETRLQGSLSSEVSLLKAKLDNLTAKVASAIGKVVQPKQSEAELRHVLEEINALIQRDLFQDISQLLKDRLAELRSLVSRVRAASAGLIVAPQRQTEQGKLPTPQPAMGVPQPNHDVLDRREGEIASLREEINRLYNLTEREPRFQAFWVLRDAYPSWLHIAKIARTLNTTPSDVHSNLTVFERIGLVEIREGEARAMKLVRPNKPVENR